MGADFVFAAAEMPLVPTIDGRGLWTDESAKKDIIDRLRVTIYTNRQLLCDLLEQNYYDILEENAGNLGIEVDWDNDVLVYMCAPDVFNQMHDDLLKWWRGDWDRQWGFYKTYDSEGNPIKLVVAGDMSWGEVPEMCDLLWRFSMLPSKWWVTP